jgi:alpha-tubulin suppressor-like RCC1 family protein
VTTGSGRTTVAFRASGLSTREVTISVVEILDLAAGGWDTCLLTDADGVYCFGSSYGGRPTPLYFPGKVTKVSISDLHGCALLEEGTVYCFGRGDRLGKQEPEDSPSPVRVEGVPPLVELRTGYDHTCGLTADGEAYCWGPGSHGHGPRERGHRQLVPAPVATDLRFRAVEPGSDYTCGIALDFETYCWGLNQPTIGILGIGVGDLEIRPYPVRLSMPGPMTDISLSTFLACSLGVGGEVACWGVLNSGIVSFRPVLITSPPASAMSSDGAGHSCVLAVGGEASCWGGGGSGRLGNGTTELAHVLTPVSGSHRFDRIRLGNIHSCARNVRLEWWCWGNDTHGQTKGNGPGDTTNPLPQRLLPRPLGIGP